jgi:hypothetical protein
LDARPSGLGKRSVVESVVRKGDEILFSIWFSGRRRSYSHSRPLHRRRRHCREREEG